MSTTNNENYVTITVKIDGVKIEQTVKLPFGKGNPLFVPQTVDGGIDEAANSVRTMLTAQFGDIREKRRA